jgi:hypothetical protein
MMARLPARGDRSQALHPMTFRATNSEQVESRLGFAVRRVGPSGVQYVQGDHVLSIEAARSPADLRVFAQSDRSWDPPNENEPISKEQMRSITRNIR